MATILRQSPLGLWDPRVDTRTWRRMSPPYRMLHFLKGEEPPHAPGALFRISPLNAGIHTVGVQRSSAPGDWFEIA